MSERAGRVGKSERDAAPRAGADAEAPAATATPALADAVFSSDEVIECPFPFYAALRREAPVFRNPDGGDYLVSRRADIMFVLQHPEIFSNEGYRSDPRLVDDPRDVIGLEDADLPACPIETPYNMSLSDPPDHAIKRRAAGDLVSRRRLAHAEPMMTELASELVDEFIDDGQVEFRSRFAAPMALLTICQLAGFPPEDRDRFRSWSMTSTHGRRYMDDAGVSQLRDDSADQMHYCRELIQRRQEAPRDDFLSAWVRESVERDGGVNMPYLVSELRLFLVAGNETTQRLITNTMLLLIQNPEPMRRIRNDRSLVPRALEEALRLESPTQWVSRLCLTDAEVGGVPIPAGSFVLMLFGSANRDESWDHPDSFDLDRPDVQKYHLGFGGGLHRCIGAPIARLEARISLNTVLDRMANIRLAPCTPEDLRNETLQKRVPHTLPLLFDPA
jgi:cytochrome P450